MTNAISYAQDITVKGNSKLNTDFSKYKTFTWAKTDNTSQSDKGYEVYTYSEENLAIPKKIKAKSIPKEHKKQC